MARIQSTERKIIDVTVTLTDDEMLCLGDADGFAVVNIVLVSRFGVSSPKRISYRDYHNLMGNTVNR